MRHVKRMKSSGYRFLSKICCQALLNLIASFQRRLVTSTFGHTLHSGKKISLSYSSCFERVTDCVERFVDIAELFNISMASEQV